MCDRKLDQWSVYPTQGDDDDRLSLAHAVVEQKRTECRHDRKRGEQSSGERIGVGLRHRAEYVALDPAQREQRNEADDYDRGGKKDGSVDLGRRTKDRCEFSPEAERGRSRGGPVEGRAFRKVSKDVFHHDDAGVDDETEIDCPHRPRPWRNTATCGANGPGEPALRNPMTGIAACCARATSGHAAAAPPRSVMKARRFIFRLIQSPRRRSRATSDERCESLKINCVRSR